MEKAITVSAHVPSYQLGSKLLEVVGEIQIAGRQLNKLTAKIGAELTATRDARTDAYFDQPLPRQLNQPSTPIALASVSCDGGRMQTRTEGGGRGVQSPHWRETKNALFLRMSSVSLEEDPHPQLPAPFADRRQMKDLLVGVVESVSSGEKKDATKKLSDWRPQVLFRTCLSSLEGSDAFGRMMAAEADSRGFYCAEKQSYVADGLPYNWTIQKRHFPTFTPILDFVHAIEHLYAAARAVSDGDSETTWQLHLRWAEACWQGRMAEVLAELRGHQDRLGSPPPNCDMTDPRQITAETIGYFENNVDRMEYPQYRREGLPITSAHMESYVKELNYRVKSTEKFWNDGASGEAILQVRAASLSDDNRLANHLRSRPGYSFHPNARAKPPSLAIAS